MKQRFSSLDVRVIAAELNASLTTLRVSNLYDLSSRIFLFKFAKPGRREQLLLDSGFRCHLTSFTRTAASEPSAFVSRLRRYLKSRRVTSVSQVGTDRIIEISFSDGHYKLYLEFFAAGNIILTDADLTVLALLRQVSEGDEAVDVRVGLKYVLHAKQNYDGIPDVTEDRARLALQQALDRIKTAQDEAGKKAKRVRGANDLRKALSTTFPEFPPHLLHHVFVRTGVNVTWKAEEVLDNQDRMVKLMDALNEARKVFANLGQGSGKGYIIATLKDGVEASAELSRKDVLYDDFHPFRPAQFADQPGVHIFEIDGFNKTVDDFYSSIESQRLETKLTDHQDAANRKLQRAKEEHEKRLGALQHAQELHIRKAQAIEANTHRVEETCAAVNGLIGQGMDWVDIGKLIENEQLRGNSVAQMIKLPLKLEENTITLLLAEPGYMEDESESDEEDRTDDEPDSDNEIVSKTDKPVVDKRLSVDIDLAMSPWANARQYYEQKKQAAVKEQKTVQASAKALKSTEKKIQEDLKKGLKQEKDVLRPSRRQLWFEKFLWFISSDGYLVLGGKDAHQNELLYRRYLKKGDLYVHADLNGASSVIIKNNPQTPDAPVPPSTLSQAGALTVCTSNAWDSKAVMAAWWVNADQVSKTAPTGEYLATGGFVVRGKKNFLSPSQLLLGFGIMWLISEDSRANHGKYRLHRTESMFDGEAEALAADAHSLVVKENDVDSEQYSHLDAAHGASIPDIEDTADVATREILDDVESGGHRDGDGGSPADEEDKVSTVASEVEIPSSNPLQSGDVLASSDEHQSDDDDASSEGSNNAPDHLSQVAGSSRPDTPASSVPSSNHKQKQLARGKRTKAKRVANKYEWQDDDDRELAMALLGSTKAVEHRRQEEEERAAKLAKAEADKDRRRKQHEKNAEKERERQARLDRGEVDLGEEMDAEQLAQERREHANIDLLVAQPAVGDELVAAIPVVAPWTALAKCKYKIKLQPGNTKKGKAVKEMVASWTALSSKGRNVVDESGTDKERVWLRELELIKAWRVEEIVGVVPVKGVRIVQGGGLGGSGGSGGGSGSAGAKGKGPSGGGGGGRGGKGSKKGR